MKLEHLRLVLLATVCSLFAQAEFHYDNEITAEPEIECGYGVVHFKVHTAKGEASQVFVKGNSGNPDCVFHNTKNITIELAKCNIRRKREINPSGVAYQMTVIVQLHPLFVTKVDRAYNVNCFYMEKQQRVNYEFGVSDLTTRSVQSDAELPTCKYSVHRDSPNGPMVLFSKVGEVLYHVWSCKSDMYKMLLSNCKVVDGKGTEFQLIDVNGCSTDEYLFPQVTYSDDITTAMVETAAFNFPDRNTMYFSCKIRLCYTNDNCNAVTPPKCGRKAAAERFGSTTDATSIELAGHGDGTTITDALDNDQLISSTTPLSALFEERRDSSQESTTEQSTTSTTTQRATQASTTTQSTTTTTIKASSTNIFGIPSDFPRPAFLPQDDNGSGESVPPEVDAWMVSDETTPAAVSKNDSTTQAPVQLLKKKSGKTETTTKQPQRQQKRNATPMPKRLVDLDVNSPELTIMDDYVENPAGNEPSIQSQKQVYRVDPNQQLIINKGICFSPIMMVAIIGIIVLMFVTVVVILLITRRRGMAMHKFYS